MGKKRSFVEFDSNSEAKRANNATAVKFVGSAAMGVFGIILLFYLFG